MDFKLVSKNNLGAVATLFLVILLSHARFFDFLIDTALGRAILILFILGISYTNKILGVVAVLFIIIAFNNSDIGYLEGFGATPTPNTPTPTPNTPTPTPDTSTPTPNTPTPNTTKGTKEKVDVSKPVSNSVSKPESKGIEGFNITEREGLMLRGRRSSEVPVYSNARNQDDDVEACDKSVFAGNYSYV
jgi:hypothetical protein